MKRGTSLPLAAMAISVFVVANDVTALSVALPQIEQDFDSDVTTVQWVVSAYALVFGVLIVTGGRLADMLGRRRVFFMGAGIFAAFSLLRRIDSQAYDVTVVSPRNYFLFTPLLPSTTVGTVEFRTIVEPIRARRGV